MLLLCDWLSHWHVAVWSIAGITYCTAIAALLFLLYLIFSYFCWQVAQYLMYFSQKPDTANIC